MTRVSGLAEPVRMLLLRGEVAPGERIPEVQRSERFRVARSTLREALRTLEGEGLLVANASGGMRVIALDAEAVGGLLEVRAALEALSAGLAARRVREGGLGVRTVRA